MEPLKVWIISLPDKKRRALLFSVDSPSLWPKTFAVSFFAWSADKNGDSVPRGKTSSSCSILSPIYLKRRISGNICFQICSSLDRRQSWFSDVPSLTWGRESNHMAAINGKTRSISTIPRKNRGLWTVYEFCDKSVNLFFEKLIYIKVILFLIHELFR